MKCSVCSSGDHRVLDTVEREAEIRRRRQCARCGHRWTTFERDEASAAPVDRDAALASLAALQAALRQG